MVFVFFVPRTCVNLIDKVLDSCMKDFFPMLLLFPRLLLLRIFPLLPLPLEMVLTELIFRLDCRVNPVL